MWPSPETLPSSPPEMPSRSSRPSVAGRSRSSGPSAPRHRRSPAPRRSRPAPCPQHGQRNEHLPATQRRGAHVVLHDGLTAGERVLRPQAIKDPLGLLPEWRRSRPSTAPAWAASLALSAGSLAESNNPTSCVPSPGPIQTPARPTVDFCPRPKPLAVYAHRSPPGTSLRCPTISALGSTEPNQFRYPPRPRYFVKQKSGGLLLLRRITPLPPA